MGRIGVLASIGGMANIIGMVFITCVTACIGYFIIIGLHEEELASFVGPLLIVVMMGYVLGKLFMNVFGLAVDTTLQCFCADEELNQGASDFTPEELKGFLKDPNSKKFGCC